MKNYRELEKQLLTTSESVSIGLTKILRNLGQAVAFVTAVVAVIITFTEVAFSTLTAEELIPSALALTVCSYIIYFSLEDAGERLGEESNEYIMARERFLAAKSRLTGSDGEKFSIYLENYAKRELEFRRRGILISYGIAERELEEYLKSDKATRRLISKEKRRILSKLTTMKAAPLTARILFSEERSIIPSGLESPEKKKLAHLILKIIPSTLCMFVTVSVVLNVKSDMTAADIFNGIIKLTALPLVGFRGYSLGYLFAKNSLSAWLNQKAEIIEGFVKDGNEIMPKGD